MDVAQMLISAVMPGAALPNSSETSAGDLTPSPLFREMFAKVAMTAGLPGKTAGEISGLQQAGNGQIPSGDQLLMARKGAVLSTQVPMTSGNGAQSEKSDSVMSGLPEGKAGILLARAMAQQQTIGTNARILDQRGLSLPKGGENRRGPKSELSEGQLETELLSGSEILPSTDIPTREKPAKVSEMTDAKREIPQAENTDEAVVPVLLASQAGLIDEQLTVPVAQVTPRALAVGMPEAAPRPATAEAVTMSVRTAGESVRELLPAVQDGTERQLQPQPAGADGKPEVFVKNAGFALNSTEEKVISPMQSEITGTNAVPEKTQNSSPAATAIFHAQPDLSGDLKSAGLSVAVSSSDRKAAVDVVDGGDQVVDKKESVHVVRNENGPAMKEAQQDTKFAGKGETVMRELPSGVTVLNPAQTVRMGRPAMAADALPSTVEGAERGRITLPEGETREEHGRDLAVTGENEKNLQQKEAFSAQNNSNMGHNSEGKSGNHNLSQKVVSSGSFDAVSKGDLGPLSEVPREHETSALHENILSQVREKLVSQDLSGTVSKISLKLNPHELGELQIHVRLEDQKMKVDITAQNPLVKEALLQNLDQLKDTLMRQNISMERFNVSTGDGQGQAFNQSFREGRQSAYQTPETFSYPLSGYYQEGTQVRQAAFADSRENSLIDMRF